MERPDPRDLDRIARAVGERPTAMEWAAGHGAPSNRRYVATLGDRSVFVKVAAFEYTAAWLRIEHDVYEALDGAPFLPRLIGWDDDGTHPTLVLEDLSAASWPPPWDRSRVEAVLAAFEEIHAIPPPGVAGPIGDVLTDIREGWSEIRSDPDPVLALGVSSRPWLMDHLDELEAAADAAVIDGTTFVHVDVRSDNLCFRGDRAVIVDWNWASRGDPVFDVAAWLPSLAAERGPQPWEVLPEAGRYASLLAGFFLAHCVRPPIPQAPHVRSLQETNGRAALRWTIRVLGLPDPDGTGT
jgi:Phosphotransferase enzyme family